MNLPRRRRFSVRVAEIQRRTGVPHESVLRDHALSSPVRERSQIYRGVAHLEGLGFNVIFGPHARDSSGYLAGRDQDRAADSLNLLARDERTLRLPRQ